MTACMVHPQIKYNEQISGRIHLMVFNKINYTYIIFRLTKWLNNLVPLLILFSLFSFISMMKENGLNLDFYSMILCWLYACYKLIHHRKKDYYLVFSWHFWPIGLIFASEALHEKENWNKMNIENWNKMNISIIA